MLEVTGVWVVDLPADMGWRTRLGALLLVERVQVKQWNLAKAAKEAALDAGTITRIEHGDNYEVVKLERYAETLGRPLDAWMREVLAVPDDLLERLKDWSARGGRSGADARSSAGSRQKARVILLSEHFPFWRPCQCGLERRRCYPRVCRLIARGEL